MLFLDLSIYGWHKFGPFPVCGVPGLKQWGVESSVSVINDDVVLRLSHDWQKSGDRLWGGGRGGVAAGEGFMCSRWALMCHDTNIMTQDEITLTMEDKWGASLSSPSPSGEGHESYAAGSAFCYEWSLSVLTIIVLIRQRESCMDA